MTRLVCFALWASLFIANPAVALDFPKGDPVELGFNPAKFAELDQTLLSKIDAGQFPGAIVLVVRNGKAAHFSVLGKQTADGSAMQEDAIFRLYSMTKPIVSVAVMRLIETGELSLDDPVSKYLPAFRSMTVATGELDADGKMATVPAAREITISDLLTHTSGLGSRLRGKGPVQAALRKARVYHQSIPGDESAAKLAATPLRRQPGEMFFYGHSTDLLGTIIETATGKPLANVLQELVLTPLRMNDTSFQVIDPAKHNKIAEPFPDDKFAGKFPLFDVTKAYPYQSASAGLVGTTNDYARFCQMLLNGGELDGSRVLSAESVNAMLTDHLGDIDGGMLAPFNLGFGYGFAVFRQNGRTGAEGTSFWGGGAGTTFWVDPKNSMFGVFMVQSAQHGREARNEIRPYVYGGLQGHVPAK